MLDVTLYTRADCPLCEKAKASIRASGAQVRLTEVDIDGDPELRERYTDDVPVIRVAGRDAFRHRVTPEVFAEYVYVLESGWRIVDDHQLERELRFPDFAGALAFTNTIGAIAEELNHHPDIHLAWGKVRVVTWSHDVNALTQRDFHLAAAISRAVAS